VAGAKVASLGLRVRKGCSYHGLALNVDMDLEPFDRINPCGFQGLQVTSMQKLLNAELDVDATGEALLNVLVRRLDAAASR
jgi:lipoyl(octanoyl) transferase